MFCKHYMMGQPTTVLDQAPLSEALSIMVKKHMQDILVVNAAGQFVGEMKSFLFSRLLLPEDAEGRTITEAEAEQESAEEVDNRLLPYLQRRVADFVNPDIPTVGPETPLGEALKLLASGALRLPVVEGEDRRLVGALSSLTVLRRFQF